MRRGVMFKKTAETVEISCIYFSYIIDFDIDKIYNVSP